MTILHKLAGSGAVLGAAMALVMAVPAAHAADGYNGYCYMKKKDARTNGAVIGALAGGAIGGTVSNTHHKGVGTVLGAAVGAAVGANVGADSVKCYNGAYYSFQHGQYNPPAPPEGYETVYYRSQPGETYYSHVEYQAYSDQGGGYESPAPVDHYYERQDAPPPPAGQHYTYTRTDTYGSAQGYGDHDYGNAPVRHDDHYDDAARDDGQSGWQDDEGRWHRGRPRAIGWQDDNGQWHEGAVVRYGWRDRDGHWHASQPDAQPRYGN